MITSITGMKKITALIIILNLLALNCAAQFYIEPVAGFQLDVNNPNSFKQVNTAVQSAFRKSRHYEIILLLQKTWPVTYTSQDSAFSTNPALPVYAHAKKTICAASFSLAVGHRLTIIGGKTNGVFSVLLYSGLNIQRFAVAYQYDKTNYTILNPDRTLNIDGFFISGGLEYLRLLKKGRLFTQLIVATPPARQLKYPASFGLMAPFSLNAGYSIMIKNTKHGK